MARINFTLHDGRLIRVEYSLAGDPHNCGYRLLGYLSMSINPSASSPTSVLRNWDYYAIPEDLAKVVAKLVLEKILSGTSVKRYVMSAYTKAPLKGKTFNVNEAWNTYWFIKHNRLSHSKPVKGNHSNERNPYQTILAWVDHDHAVKYTKHDQAIHKQFIKEISNG